MYFSNLEKQAIAKLVMEMIAADGKTDPDEMILSVLVTNKLGIDNSHLQSATTLPANEAITIIKNMTYDEKRLVSALLGSIMAADNDINAKEILLWQFISSLCDFPTMNIDEAKRIIGQFYNE